MALTFEQTPYVGAVFGDGTGSKITAADGITGVVLMLSYYAGKSDLFPQHIRPEMFCLDEHYDGNKLLTDLSLVHKLQAALSIYIKHELGGVKPNSFAQYISHIRQGRRPNEQPGTFPAVPSSFERKTGLLVIGPRSYEDDIKNGLNGIIPYWIRVLANEKGM